MGLNSKGSVIAVLPGGRRVDNPTSVRKLSQSSTRPHPTERSETTIMSYNGEWGSPPEGSSGESSRNGALNPPSSSSPPSSGGPRNYQPNWTGRLNPVDQGGWTLPIPSQYSQYYGNNAQHPGLWDGAGPVRHSPTRMRSSSSSLAGALGGFNQYQGGFTSS